MLVSCLVVSSAFVACDKENDNGNGSGNGSGNESEEKTLKINSEKTAKALLSTVYRFLDMGATPYDNFSYEEAERFEYDEESDCNGVMIKYKTGVCTIQGIKSKSSGGYYPNYWDNCGIDVKFVFDNLFYQIFGIDEDCKTLEGLTILSGYGTYEVHTSNHWSPSSSSLSGTRKFTLNSCSVHWIYNKKSCDATVTIEFEEDCTNKQNTATVKVKDGKEFHFSMGYSDWNLELD